MLGISTSGIGSSGIRGPKDLKGDMGNIHNSYRRQFPPTGAERQEAGCTIPKETMAAAMKLLTGI